MKRVSWIILLLVVFSLALAACSSSEPEVVVEEPAAVEEPSSQEEEPAALTEVNTEEDTETAVSEEPVEETAAQEPVEEPVEEVQANTEVALSDLQFSSLDDLSSYRYTMVMDMTATDSAGEETMQSIQMELAVSTDPPATSMLMTAQGTADIEEMGEMEFVQIGDTSYINMTGMGCMALPADDNSVMDTDELTDGFSPESITEDLENVTLVGEETINGIDVFHYTYDETSMTAEEAVGITSLEGHIYLAKDGGYMVRSIIDVVGDSEFMEGFASENAEPESAVTHVELNLTDVNEAVEILPPAACEGQEAPEATDWPMLEDATEVTAFAGIVSYTTETSGNDAIDFYNNAMVEMGYTLDEGSSFITEGTGLITFVNADGESVTVTIAEDTDSGLTSVTILADAEA